MADIDADLVRRLVSSQFPQWATLDIRPVQHDGHDNRTFRLGERMSVRLPSAGAYAAQVEKEHGWLPNLARSLPLEIPSPLAMGRPGEGYQWSWSVRSWIEGEIASRGRIEDLGATAGHLGEFLTALQQAENAGGPSPGMHNFERGGALSTYDSETRRAINTLRGRIDVEAARRVWDQAISATWHGPPVWVHGDVSAQNLLVRDGSLVAVIDFGCCAVGDPACDLVIAWAFFEGESRGRFRATVAADEGMWSRARGWALWKGLITLAGFVEANPLDPRSADEVVRDVLSGNHGV